MSRDQLLVQAATEFFRQFGHSPRVAAAAPARVNLIGEHTDYNDGLALPFAIGLDALVVAAFRPAGSPVHPAELRAFSTGYGEATVFHPLPEDASQTPFSAPARLPSMSWAALIQGVVSLVPSHGRQTHGIDLLVHSAIPAGSGLSSSAAVSVATCLALLRLMGDACDAFAVARICQRAEQEFSGVPCGLMDQLTSLLGRRGHLLLTDFQSSQVELVPFPAEVACLMVDSGVRHRLARSEYVVRRDECRQATEALSVQSLRMIDSAALDQRAGRLHPRLLKRVRHVVTENERVLAARSAIGRGDWAELGQLLFASHRSLRDDYEVSCPELDRVVDAARQIGVAGGVFGARLTGGGFGGCAIHLVAADRASEVGRLIASQQASSRPPVAAPLAVWPSGGAATCLLDDTGQRLAEWSPAGNRQSGP
jgi:galactokinase